MNGVSITVNGTSVIQLHSIIFFNNGSSRTTSEMVLLDSESQCVTQVKRYLSVIGRNIINFVFVCISIIAFLVKPSNLPRECTFVLVISRNAERQYTERQYHGQINVFFIGADTENFSLTTGIDLATM